ncbi:MAG: hypothetical protein KatS3mg033_1017 [Thermonema sp.]|uniref:HYC_CC_PP family protein n=1 Tax=Thermonema sp. TaxID=2231181 RepID=UPI0021DC3B0E|nr:hypothetical protein [Thermonema sp.]GIV39217.1 MAG: hypothetical protein KatS3mg033_1017 [Thermonema sp.]
MKAFLSIWFAMVMLLSQTGVSVWRHYCGSHLVKEQRGIVVQPEGCGMEQIQAEDSPCPGEALSKAACCTNEWHLLQLKEDYTPSQAALPLASPVWVLLLVVFVPTVFLRRLLQAPVPLAVFSPPRRKGRQWLRLLCQWRI